MVDQHLYPAEVEPGSPSPSREPSTVQKIMPFLGIILSAACGGLWSLYTMLRIGESEPVDCLTPIVMVMFPVGLWIFSKQIDQLLDPVFAVRDKYPRPIMIGAALALPLMLGIVCSSVRTAGYGAMRWTAILSIIGAYLLTRKRQVRA
ncbi:MAG: hypothetical protein JXA25_01470 [Anaerolineales bacterium]|nr:hypothetical protein [Anaerolineales bacterium]